MRKKIIVVGLLAGGAALTGLAGSAHAEGGTTAPGPGKTAGPAGKPITVHCVGTAVPGKGVPGKGVPGKAVPGKAGTGKGGELIIRERSGAEWTGTKPPALPPRGRTVLKTGGGKALPAPPPGATVTRGGPVTVFKDGKGTTTIKPPKGMHCSVGHSGLPSPVGGKPPVSTRPASGS